MVSCRLLPSLLATWRSTSSVTQPYCARQKGSLKPSAKTRKGRSPKTSYPEDPPKERKGNKANKILDLHPRNHGLPLTQPVLLLSHWVLEEQQNLLREQSWRRVHSSPCMLKRYNMQGKSARYEAASAVLLGSKQNRRLCTPRTSFTSSKLRHHMKCSCQVYSILTLETWWNGQCKKRQDWCASNQLFRITDFLRKLKKHKNYTRAPRHAAVEGYGSTYTSLHRNSIRKDFLLHHHGPATPWLSCERVIVASLCGRHHAQNT